MSGHVTTSDGVRWDAELIEWIRGEAQRTGLLLHQVVEFCGHESNKDDAIAQGVRRIIRPPKFCDDCGQIDDFGVGDACSCWSEITPEDVDQIRSLGVEIEEREEGE